MRLRKVKYFTKNYPECIVDSGFGFRSMRSCAHFPCFLLGIKRYVPGGFMGPSVMIPRSIPYLAFLKLSSIERHLSCMSPSWTSTQRLFVEDEPARTRISTFRAEEREKT